MKCEKIRDNFERKFHKKGPADTQGYCELLTKFREPDLSTMTAEMDAQENLGKEWNW
jgi:hypothetical protein